MSPTDVDALKSFISAGGTIAVLVYMVRYFQAKLDKKDDLVTAKDATIAGIIEKQAARDVVISATLERIASAIDRMERRMDVDNFSGPHKRSNLTDPGTP